MKTQKQLSRDAIEKFKIAYQEEFGETLLDDEAREIATRLLQFFGVLLTNDVALENIEEYMKPATTIPKS